MSNISDPAAALGRLLLSVIFVMSGFEKLTAFSGTVGYMAQSGLPFPELATAVAIVVELGGGLLLIAGYQARFVGLVLASWCIATALIAHAHFGDENQAIHFMKNVAMTGGFLQLVAF